MPQDLVEAIPHKREVAGWCTHTKNIGRLYPYHEHSKAPIPRTLHRKPHNHYKDHFTTSNCREMVGQSAPIASSRSARVFCVGSSNLAKGCWDGSVHKDGGVKMIWITTHTTFGPQLVYPIKGDKKHAYWLIFKLNSNFKLFACYASRVGEHGIDAVFIRLSRSPTNGSGHHHFPISDLFGRSYQFVTNSLFYLSK